jgi:heme-degrading monooxygenase HmoA
MIRVVYHWSVTRENIPAFRDAWREATYRIHREVNGARGSFLLQQAGDPGEILTIARWESEGDWRAFWQEEDPGEMRAMRDLGKRGRVEVYDEFADCTV